MDGRYGGRWEGAGGKMEGRYEGGGRGGWREKTGFFKGSGKGRGAVMDKRGAISSTLC